MIPKYNKEKKWSWQDIFFAVLMSSLILIIVGFLVISNYKMSQKREVLNSRIEQLKEEIGTLQERKQQLEAQANQANQEEYLEKEAREKFNLQKPGEEVVVILPQAEKNLQQKEKIRQWWNPLSW